MNNRISRYIFAQLLFGLVMATLAVTMVVWLSQSLRFVEMIVNRGLGAGMFLSLTGLMMPNFLSITMPVALFMVIVFYYHKMIMDRELVVMRAAGLGQMSLATPALVLAGVVVGIGYLLSTSLVPMSYNKFREMQWDIRYNLSNVLLREGAFNEVADGITVYVRKRTADDQLLGILAHDSRNSEKSFTLMAERGAMVRTDDGVRVVMFNGNRQEFDRETNQFSLLYFDRYLFDVEQGPAGPASRYREPRELSMPELLEGDFSSRNDEGKFRLEVHRRIALPWSALGLAIIALAPLLGGSFTRRGERGRVIAAVAIAALYQGSLMAAMNVVAKNPSLAPLIYVIAFTPVAIGGGLALKPFFEHRHQTPLASGNGT